MRVPAGCRQAGVGLMLRQSQTSARAPRVTCTRRFFVCASGIGLMQPSHPLAPPVRSARLSLSPVVRPCSLRRFGISIVLPSFHHLTQRKIFGRLWQRPTEVRSVSLVVTYPSAIYASFLPKMGCNRAAYDERTRKESGEAAYIRGSLPKKSLFFSLARARPGCRAVNASFAPRLPSPC